MGTYCFYYGLVQRHMDELTRRGVWFNSMDIARMAHLPVDKVDVVFDEMWKQGLLRYQDQAASSNGYQDDEEDG